MPNITNRLIYDKYYSRENVAAQEKDPQSILNYFRQMLQLRKSESVFIYGDLKLVDANNPDVFAYTRSLHGKTLLILLNFKATEATSNTGLNLKGAKALIGNYPNPSTDGQLRPYEAVILASDAF